MSVDPAVRLGLGLMIAVLALQRVSELLISRRHEEALRGRGAVEFGREQFPWFVALHVGLPLGIVAEVLFLGARPGEDWPWMLLLLAAAALLRAASIRALGDRWHVRVRVIPGERPMTHGVYRLLRHPNYAAVVLECAALPLLFGAWRSAIAASAVNLVLLAMRVRLEENALAWAAAQPSLAEAEAGTERSAAGA